MKTRQNSDSWKEKYVHLWEKMMITYHHMKSSFTVKLLIRFICLFLRVVFPVVIKRILSHFFRDF